jgi:hypothetical protein
LGPESNGSPSYRANALINTPETWRPAIERASQLAHALNEVETSQNVDEWQIDGVQMWPLLRQIAGAFTQRALFTNWDHLAPLLGALRHQAAAPRTSNAPDACIGSIAPFDSLEDDAVWFLGNTAAYVELAGYRFHSLFDPLRGALEDLGHKTYSLLLHYDETKGRAMSPPYVGGNHALTPFVKHAYGPGAARTMELGSQISQFAEQLRQHRELQQFPSLYISLHPALLTLFVSRVLSVRDNLLPILANKTPKAIAFYPSFTPLAYGTILAARAARIPIIEMQHGINGLGHHGYTWAHTPHGGWNSTPGEMLAWTKSDTNDFRSMGGTKAYLHGPGSLRLAKHLQEEKPLSSGRAAIHAQASEAFSTQSEALRNIANRYDGKCLLYAPQYHVRDQRLTGAINRLSTRHGCKLLRREHPVAQMPHIKEGNQAAPSGDDEIATSAPLAAVLASCAGVITGFSSIFLEAAALDCRTISTTSASAIYYDSYLAEFGSNAVNYVDQPEVLDDAIDALPVPSVDPLSLLSERLQKLPASIEIARQIVEPRDSGQTK